MKKNRLIFNPRRAKHAIQVHWVNRLDYLGIGLSTLCMVHCALTPLILIALPYLGATLTEGDTLHTLFAILLPILALLAFVPGYRVHHDKTVILLGIAGLVIIILGLLVGSMLHHADWKAVAMESMITIVGSTLLVTAHYRNRLRCAGCEAAAKRKG